MKICFQADADLNEEIVSGLIRHEPEIDFKTAGEAGLWGLSDTEVLHLATSENRVLVTHDRRTMPGHFADYVQGNHSPGVIVIAQNVSVRRAIDELFLVWSASEDQEWSNLIVDLPL